MLATTSIMNKNMDGVLDTNICYPSWAISSEFDRRPFRSHATPRRSTRTEPHSPAHAERGEEKFAMAYRDGYDRR